MTTDTNQTSKLEADLFGAEDLDGMTESLMGSGSLNYLVLQSQQTDLAAMITSGNPENTGETGLTNLSGGTTARLSSPQEAAGQARDFQITNAEAGNLSTALSSGNGVAKAPVVETVSSHQNSAQSAITSTQESSLTSFNNTGFSNRSNVETAVRGAHGENGENGQSGNNGANGTNGLDGGGGGDPDQNIFIDIDKTINLNPVIDIDILDDLDILNNIVINLGDVTNTVINIFDYILPDNPQDPNDTDLVIDLGVIGPIDLQQHVDVLLDPIENILGDIDVNIVPDIDLANGVIDLGIDALAAGISLPPIDLSLDAGALLTQDGLQETLESVQNTVTDILGDTSIDAVVGNLLAPPVDGSDTDLSIDLGETPLDTVLPADIHIPLDLVEGLTGDIDLNVVPALDLDTGNVGLDIGGILTNTPLPDSGISTEDLGLDQMIADITPDDLTGQVDDLLTAGESDPLASINNLVEEITEGIGLEDNLTEDPFADIVDFAEQITGETGNGGDSDLVINVDAILPELDTDALGLSDTTLDVPLDPVEMITGDIDLELESAIDLLSGENLLTANAESTGSGDGGIWPENPIIQTVDQLIDSLPDDGLGLTQETGSISEGLGLLDLTDSIVAGSGSSGGLFGGLFG